MGARKRVLLVEDDPSLRNLVRSYLVHMGLDVTEAADGESGISRLNQEPPDLVCLDLMLPKSSGYEVCEHVRRTDSLKHVPVLILSARTLPEDRAYAEEVGASAFLTKPFSRAEFTRRVRDMLDGKHVESEV